MPPSRLEYRALHVLIPKPKYNATALSFFQLPPEIRNDIYSRLLILDRHEDTGYYLDTSILRVNKQIHAEASLIMRKKHCWVILSLQENVYDSLFTHPIIKHGSELAFLKNLPGIDESSFKSAQEHAFQLSVQIQHPGPYEDIHEDKYRFLVSPFALSKIWRWFPQKMKHPGRALTATLSLPNPHVKLDSFLSSLNEFRGFDRVDFDGVWPNQWVHQIRSMLTQSAKTADDLLEIMSSYRSRALQQLELGDTQNARSTYSEAYDCIVSWDIEHAVGFPHFNNGENGDQFYECRLQIILSHASLLARFGCPDKAGVLLNRTFEKVRLWPTRARWGEEIAEAHFLMGFAYLRMGLYNAAVYYFMEALHLEPGHLKADQALDDLELRLKVTNDPKHRLARRNIEQAAKPFRHRERQGRLTKQAYERRCKYGRDLPFRMLRHCRYAAHKVRYEPIVID